MMSRKSWFTKDKLQCWGIFLLLFLEISILVYVFATGYAKEKLTMDIPYSDFTGTTIPDDRGGWYCDATFPLPEDGLFEYSLDIMLEKGTYDITIYYETDTDSHYCLTTASTKDFWGLSSDTIKLTSKNTAMTCTVALRENVDDFRLETYYGGTGYLIVKGFTITQTRADVRVHIAVLTTFFILFDLGWLALRKGWIREVTEKQLVLSVSLVAIILLSSYPLLSGYIMRSHDIGFHMLRIDGIADGLRSGQFPVKIQPNWLEGYGYPVSVYYPDLFLYFPGILRLIGFSATFSYHALLFICNVATVLIAYGCFRRIAGDKIIGLLGAFLYTVSPYRLTDLYVRNAVGESLAMTFFPLLVCGLYMVFTRQTDEKEYDRLWIPMVIGFSGIIQSHVLSCLMSGLFVLLACVFFWRRVMRGKTFLVLAKTVIYTALLNAWFLVPCMLSMKDIEVMQAYRGEDRIQSRGTFLIQLFNLFYRGAGDSYSVSVGTYGEMAFGIGLTLGLGLFLYVLAMLCAGKRKQILKGKLIFGLTLLSLFMTTIYFPWDWLSATIQPLSKGIANIQFATRFLAISCVLAATVFCMALQYFKQQGKDCKLVIVAGFLLATISFQSMMDNRISVMGAEHIYDTASVGRTDYNVKEYLRPGTVLNKLSAGGGLFVCCKRTGENFVLLEKRHYCLVDGGKCF